MLRAAVLARRGASVGRPRLGGVRSFCRKTERDKQRKMDAPSSARRSDPIGGVLFGRDASLPAMVLALGVFFYLNYQGSLEEAAEAQEVAAKASHDAKIREARVARRNELDAPARLAFKVKQLEHFQSDASPGAAARVAKLRGDVAALKAEIARGSPPP